MSLRSISAFLRVVVVKFLTSKTRTVGKVKFLVSRGQGVGQQMCEWLDDSHCKEPVDRITGYAS
jgi:hypothetical protein